DGSACPRPPTEPDGRCSRHSSARARERAHASVRTREAGRRAERAAVAATFSVESARDIRAALRVIAADAFVRGASPAAVNALGRPLESLRTDELAAQVEQLKALVLAHVPDAAKEIKP